MLSAELFETLSAIGSRIRSDSRPFGGIQLILCGDFFQLPPVPEKNGRCTQYCFESPTWEKLFMQTKDPLGKMLSLKRVFRQKDNDFLRILSEVSKFSDGV